MTPLRYEDETKSYVEMKEAITSMQSSTAKLKAREQIGSHNFRYDNFQFILQVLISFNTTAIRNT